MSVDEFWAACQRELPADTAGKAFRVHCFGNNPAMSKRLLDLIRAGEKTGTFAVDWEFDTAPERRPKAGDLVIVTDATGEPGALIRIIATELLPFSSIGVEHVQSEGPALRDVGLWRKVHWDYWTGSLRRLGREPAEDRPVLYQRFELLKR